MKDLEQCSEVDVEQESDSQLDQREKILKRAKEEMGNALLSPRGRISQKPASAGAMGKAESMVSEAAVKWQYCVFEKRAPWMATRNKRFEISIMIKMFPPQQKLYFFKKANAERDTWSLCAA